MLSVDSGKYTCIYLHYELPHDLQISNLTSAHNASSLQTKPACRIRRTARQIRPFYNPLTQKIRGEENGERDTQNLSDTVLPFKPQKLTNSKIDINNANLAKSNYQNKYSVTLFSLKNLCYALTIHVFLDFLKIIISGLIHMKDVALQYYFII